MPHSLRLLTTGDLAQFRELHRLGLAESADAFVESESEDAERPDAEVAAILARGETWGAFDGERLQAKVGIEKSPGRMVAHTCWLRGLYLHPSARGSGLAQTLVQRALAHARASRTRLFLLWVTDENQRAKSFYKSLGFMEIGRVPGGLNIAGRDIDDVLMCLKGEASD